MTFTIPAVTHVIGEAVFRPRISISLAALRAPRSLPAFLFENHPSWWIALILLGVLALLIARWKNTRIAFNAGILLFATAILWIAPACIFITPAERLHAAHSALANAAQKQDIDAVLRFLAPDFKLQGVSLGPADSAARDQLAQTLRQTQIREIHINNYQSTLNGDHAATTVTVMVTADGIPPLTTWRVSWFDEPSADWQITGASLTAIDNQPLPPGGISASP